MFKSSGMLPCVNWQKVADVSKNFIAFFFKVSQSKKARRVDW
jgi:hypothetical protein